MRMEAGGGAQSCQVEQVTALSDQEGRLYAESAAAALGAKTFCMKKAWPCRRGCWV